ncbi:MAG: PDZ domain-containing protein [Pirellulales bacterium]
MPQPGQSGFGVEGGLEGQADFGADGFGGTQGDFENRTRAGFRRDRRTQFGTNTQFDNNIQGDFDRRRARRDQANRFGTDTDFDNRVVGGGVDRRSRFSQGRDGTFGDFVAERAGRAARGRFDDRFGARLDGDFDDEFGDRFDADVDARFGAQFDDDEQFDDLEGRVFDERDFGGRRPGFRDNRRNFANRRASDVRDADFDFNRFDDDLDRVDRFGDVSARFRGNLRSSLGLAFEQGGGSELVLSNVPSDSLAADAGLLAGDEILAANGQRIRNFGDLVSMLRTNRTNEPIELIIDRNGRRQTVTLMLPEDFLIGGSAGFDAFGERVSREARRRNALRRSQPFGDF